MSMMSASQRGKVVRRSCCWASYLTHRRKLFESGRSKDKVLIQLALQHERAKRSNRKNSTEIFLKRCLPRCRHDGQGRRERSGLTQRARLGRQTKESSCQRMFIEFYQERFFASCRAAQGKSCSCRCLANAAFPNKEVQTLPGKGVQVVQVCLFLRESSRHGITTERRMPPKSDPLHSH